MGLFDNPVTGALTGGAFMGGAGALTGGAIGGGLIPNPFGGVDQPAQPDWQQLAQQQYEMSMQGARPSQFTPFGQSVWEQGPGGDWTQRTSFAPGQQQLFEAGQAGQQELLGTAMPTFGGRREQVMQAMMGRGMGDIGRAREQKASELTARGIPPGSAAYETEMDRLGRQEVDLRQQAELGATQMAGQEYGAELAGRGQRAGELQRFTPGMPQMPGFQQVPGPDIMGAAAQGYAGQLAGAQAQQAQQNQIMQGLFGLGAAGIMGSDRRLKHAIKKIGEYVKGIDIFEFSYIGSTKKMIGVMSDQVREVKPEAVIRFNDGYDRVIYGAL